MARGRPTGRAVAACAGPRHRDGPPQPGQGAARRRWGAGRFGRPGVRPGGGSYGIRCSWLTVCAGDRRAEASIRQLADVAAREGRIADPLGRRDQQPSSGVGRQGASPRVGQPRRSQMRGWCVRRWRRWPCRSRRLSFQLCQEPCPARPFQPGTEVHEVSERRSQRREVGVVVGRVRPGEHLRGLGAVVPEDLERDLGVRHRTTGRRAQRVGDLRRSQLCRR
jgi:hypothetical protein